jgi:hypothetical protein
MNTPDWKELKRCVYYEDGSLRDLYVLNTKTSDWLKWADFVNEHYTVTFYNYKSQTTRHQIIKEDVIAYLNGSKDIDHCNTATIFLGRIWIKAHFHLKKELENDITPDEFQSPDDHHKLMSYMQGVSKLLGKPMILTPENNRETVLIQVEGENISYP